MFQKFVFFLCSAAALVLFCVSCATFQPGYETPSVSITSFEPVQSDSIMPAFKIGLHIINPNRTPLRLKGISYTIALEGHKIIKGVSSELSHIGPYSQGNVMLLASMDLFSSIGLFTNLIKKKGKEDLSYNFTAKLDTGSLTPLIKIQKQGSISLTDQTSQ